MKSSLSLQLQEALPKQLATQWDPGDPRPPSFQPPDSSLGGLFFLWMGRAS